MSARPTKMRFDPKVYARMLEQPEPALDDPDNPEWTEEDFARAKGPETLPPEILAAFPNTLAYVRRMQAQTAETSAAKPKAVMRIDADIVAYFKAGGPDWRTRINAALREVMAKD